MKSTVVIVNSRSLYSAHKTEIAGTSLITDAEPKHIDRQRLKIQKDMHAFRGVNPGGLGVATPRFWAGGCRGSQGVAGGSWTGREILTLCYHVQEVCSKVETFEKK